MNLTSRKARTLLALCSVGAVVGAGVTATSAYAAGVTLAYGPTATSATVVNLDPAAAAGAPVTYGVKVTGDTNTDPLYVNSLTAPTNGALYVQKASGIAGTPSANGAGSAALRSAQALADGVTVDAADHLQSASNPFTAKDLGQAVAGTGIAAGTYIATFVGAGDVTLSADVGDQAGPLNVAVGARAVSDAATTLSSTTLTSATAAFTSADVGATIAGAGIPASTTIASVTNATTVVLSAAATATAANVAVGIGYTATGSAGGTTLTLNGLAAAGATVATVLDEHMVKVVSGSGTAEIVKVTDITNNTVTVDRALAVSHSGAVTLTDLGLANASDYFSTLGASAAAPVTYQVAAGNWATVDNFFFGAVVPGAYTFQLFKDHNGNGLYDSAQDDATPVFTLTVKDVDANTSTTSDDLSPTLSAPSTAGVGEAVTANVATGLTTVDTRGVSGSPAVGVLGTNLVTASTLAFDNVKLPNGAAASFDGTYITRTSGAAVAGTGTTTYSIGSNITRTASTLIADNTVDGIAEDVTNVAGSVKDDAGTAARSVHIKIGTGTVTYTATVTNAGTAVSGATVRFTLTAGTNSPDLTANGSLVSSNSTTKVYSAVSNSSGIATLIVTSGTTTAGTTYTVSMSSNGQTSDTLSAAYEAVAATTLENTNTDASLLVTPGSSATLTGRLLDQFDGAYVPSGSDSVQVAVRIPAGGTTVGNAVITSGAFSYTYAPTTTPTAGTQTTFDFYYSTTTLDGTDSAINWASSEAASSVTITAPVAAATPTQQKATIAPIAGTAVTGSVLNSSNSGLAYKTVTLTGTAGVYFSNVAAPTTATTDNLATTVTVASNGSGVYTGYAFFTKAGAATITATSGSATQTVNVVVTQVSDPYKVTANSATVEPGGTSIVTGEVDNGFGYPVSGATVNLSLGATTAATLGATSVTTNSDGVWSTTLTGASSGSGTATLTASLNGQTANATPHADWLANAGLTISNGTYQTTGTVTVDPTLNETTVEGPTSRVGAGYVALSGTAKPSTAVEIYGKASASSAAYGLVGLAISGTDGAWNSTQYISVTTIFFAKTTVSTSAPITVTVSAPPQPHLVVSLRATALGGGRARLAANGESASGGVMRYYWWTGYSWRYLTGRVANSSGDATVDVRAPHGLVTFRVVYSAPGRMATGVNTRIRVT
jgi:hypothetical protein